jgi:hypothetical protein
MIPAHSTEMRLQFVSWWAFLVLYFVARLLLALYMTSFGFATTKGIEMFLYPIRVTTEHIAAYHQGQSISAEYRSLAFKLDPSDTAVLIVAAESDGSVLLDGQLWPYDRPEQLCSAIRSIPSTHRIMVGVQPGPSSPYQLAVSMVDRVILANEEHCHGSFGLFFISATSS